MDFSSSILILAFRDLIIAVILGALIGLEREIARKEAGVRTFSIISLGAALFVMISRLSFSDYLGIANYDPSRVLGQIIVGMGFLGAGIIIFEAREGKVKGLTTAAIMWATSAIGAAVGLELYALAGFATALIVLLNTLILPLEKKWDEKRYEKQSEEKTENK